jgi:hypothetical protein
MVGGETAIRKPSGEVIKVRSPQMGCAVVLQGRCTNHQALAAHGGNGESTLDGVKALLTMVRTYYSRDSISSSRLIDGGQLRTDYDSPDNRAFRALLSVVRV